MRKDTIPKEDATMNRQTKEACDFLDLLKQLTSDEKQQVKGIMIGLQMHREGALETRNVRRGLWSRG